MSNSVYITNISKFLPNNPVPNDDIEDYLGLINKKKSKAKSIVLRSNGIKQRFYALDKNGNSTHSNSEITANAIKNLFINSDLEKSVELLACGTTSPDQLLPGHANMVHGLLNLNNIEVVNTSGACNSGMQAFKYCYLSILAGNKKTAICSGSERMSSWMLAKNFNSESENLKNLNSNPVIAFEKEFLRWMLSDGAGAILMQNKPNNSGISLLVEWMEMYSFANQVDACMYAGAIKSNENLIGWSDLNADEWVNKSVFSLKQDVKLLDKYIISLSVEKLKELAEKNKFDFNKVDYFLPHMSSMYFKERIYNELLKNGINIPFDKWFINLDKIGNIGSASIYVMLEELFHSGNLKKGQKILLSVPESARFSYAYSLLTVC